MSVQDNGTILTFGNHTRYMTSPWAQAENHIAFATPASSSDSDLRFMYRSTYCLVYYSNRLVTSHSCLLNHDTEFMRAESRNYGVRLWIESDHRQQIQYIASRHSKLSPRDSDRPEVFKNNKKIQVWYQILVVARPEIESVVFEIPDIQFWYQYPSLALSV